MTTMAMRLLLCAAVAVAGLLIVVAPGAAREVPRIAYSIELTGTIDAAAERSLSQALDAAADRDAGVAIVRIDTPGGLDSSTREMVKDIIDAPMPVIAYVSPDGARAASAGLFITEAADVAAMAPQTNIGSATPISIGPATPTSIGPAATDEVLGRKIENDAAAYARALADAHGRNEHLAELMVTDAVNRTAEEAKRSGMIDAVATSERELLRKLDGFRVRGPKSQRLDTEGLVIERHDSSQTADSTLAGILLLLLGVGLIIAAARLPIGFLGAAGVGVLIASGLVLYNTDSDAFEALAPVVIVTGLFLGGLVALALQRTVRADWRPVMTGWERMVGMIGEVRDPLDPLGQVFVEGALWRARPADEGTSVDRGRTVRVEYVDGLTLVVGPLAPDDEQAAGAKQTALEGAA